MKDLTPLSFHVIHRYTLQQIGDHAGLHYTTVSRIVRDERQDMLQ